ncbi:DNA polymerase III subunit alpha [Flavobacteriales bacterium]|nr:DNA polymerase III subunit alpha [Flavobacteriales bacterium]
MYLIFDTETTGLPQNWKSPLTDFNNWPRMVQLAWQVHDVEGKLVEVKNYIIKPESYDIPFNAEKIHGISTERANKQGMPLIKVLSEFVKDVEKSQFVIGHNVSFDNKIVGCELLRKEMPNLLTDFPAIDTKDDATAYCAIPGGRGGGFKWPSLTELHTKLFGEAFAEAHNASADVEATARCFLELVRLQVIPHVKAGLTDDQLKSFQEINPKPFELIGLNIEAYSSTETSDDVSNSAENDVIILAEGNVSDSPFAHLHTHSQYSILQATADVKSLVDRAVEQNMPAIGLTDHTNMFGAFKFIDAVVKHPVNAKIKKGKDPVLKAVLGCELNVCKDHLDKSIKDDGYQVPFLCKNKEGYHNLAKLSSLGFIEGFYYVPRVDKELIKKYSNGLIALTGSLYGVIPNLILNVGEAQAEKEFKWWVDVFSDDFYVELNRHDLDQEQHVNRILLSFARKYDVKIIASNNVYYLDKNDANAHDILLCVKDGELQSTPKGSGRGYRYGFPNDKYYFKSSVQMKELFADLPEAIDNITDLVAKIETFTLSRDVLLPKFDIPDEFINEKDKKDGGKRGENAYLRHLTYQGAKDRYKEITDDIKERIDFELEVVENSGYPGYFLIVQDFIAQARKMNVSVGPGRGSAAGSVVAYCIKITNVDPIKYDLLFERFLNPERISLPDIDIDFDDEGRGRIIDWVVDKYGSDNVAQIITYGTMAAKSSIRDTARVLDLPLFEADRTAKLVPDFTSLSKLFAWDSKTLKSNLKSDQIVNAKNLIALAEGKDLVSETINHAKKLEGSVRNVGTHACGIIITPEPLIGLIPMANAKDSDLMVTQFDNSVVESAGLLKMDFLGLRNLTIIKDCIKIIQKIHGIDIDVDEIPLDDQKTFEIFQKGETTGIFQFSSDGMKAHLKHLKPDKFDDLIAMNALYRPGPMEYIPNYIKRKHGNEEIKYDLHEMEEYLAPTYGITVYQEQVMLLSQKLAGFSKGDADMLRKGMGKKIKAVLDNLKPKFFSGCKANGFDITIVEKIWTDWEAFASYAFNKSHSTCYALIAYQTAYLKAHYPAELMASLLTNHMRDIKDITHYMEECKRMNVIVLGPDVNESFYKFAVNNKGEIRFGLGAVKGVGEAAVQAIVNERKENGNYIAFDDFMKRVDLRSANKRTLESVVCAGGFDSFKIKRSQYFAKEGSDLSYIERMIKFGNKVKDSLDSNQFDMFGESVEASIQAPTPPEVEPWVTMELLSKEKEVVGIYISGHPLDDYRVEIDNFCNGHLGMLYNMEAVKGKGLRFAGVVTNVEHKETKTGKPFGILHIEDYKGTFSFYLFGDDYIDYKSYFTIGWLLHINGKVKKKFYNDDLEFKISSIVLLSELIDKQVRDAVLRIDISDISEVLVNDVVDIVNDSKGKHSLVVNVVDHLNKYEVDLLSRKAKVNLDKDFIQQIGELNQLKLKIKS